MPHADFAKVAGMVFVEQNAVVVLAAGVAATAGVLTVLACSRARIRHHPAGLHEREQRTDTTMPGVHVAALLAILQKARRLRTGR